MRVLSVVVHARTREPVLLLGEVDGERCLPVFLRQPQADVIAAGLRSEGDPLLTQDLLVSVVSGLGRRLEGVEITELRDGIFSADLVFDAGTRVAARPSDALAVAVRDGIAISVADQILDDVGQLTADLFPDGTDRPPAQQLQRFHRFIEDVSPADFENPPGSS